MKKGMRTGLLLLGSCMAVCFSDSAWAAVYKDDGAPSYTSRVYSGQEDSLLEEWISGGGAEDADNGPGAVRGQEESDRSGPVIHEVTMSEKYHSDYSLYEQSIGGKYFIYSNVSNGGITDQPVYVDIPADVACTAEKDGVPISYVSGQALSDRGTYVMRLTAVSDKNVPLSQQEEYRSVFRFRIDEKRPDPAGAIGALGRQIDGLTGADTSEALNQIGSGLGELTVEGLGTDGLTGGSLAGSLWEDSSSAEDAESQGADGEEAGTEDPSAAEAAVSGEETDPQEETGGEGEGTRPSPAPSLSGGRTQVYLKDEAMYEVALEDGFTFRSSVPEGMVINQSVALYIEEGLPYTLFKGEEEASLNQRQEVSEYGIYRLVSGEYEFTFEINNGYVNRSLFTAPAGTRISEASYGEETLDPGDGRLLPMEEDGSYRITLKGDYGEQMELVLNRDTLAPDVTAAVSGQTAQITYAADDIASITLSKDGGEPQSFGGTQVTSPGRYVLAVKDKAGNETVCEFNLRYRINLYGIIAIVAAVGGITAAVVILIRKKRNLTVR